MKVRVSILEQDRTYLERMIQVFTNMYADTIEIYSFSDKEQALQTVYQSGFMHADVFLAGEGFEINTTDFPKNCAFAYFVNTPQVEMFRGKRAVCKFQKAELIYKEILALYSDVSEVQFGVVGNGEKEGIVLSFLSAGGGMGSSTVAAACARRLARAQKDVLYLDLEIFGDSASFFQGEGTFTFSDIIYAIKSNKNNLAMRIESMVRRDASGVYFFESSKMAFDVMEIEPDEIKQLLAQLKEMHRYDYIVVDMDFNFDKRDIEILKQAFRVVFVSNGTQIANSKLEKALEALSVYEQQHELKILPKINIIYNHFSSTNGRQLDDANIKVLGGVPIISGATTKQIMEQIEKKSIFDSFLHVMDQGNR